MAFGIENLILMRSTCVGRSGANTLHVLIIALQGGALTTHQRLPRKMPRYRAHSASSCRDTRVVKQAR
jgi:hypothetical protein